MSKIKLTGDTSGYVEISAPNVAGNNTLELPATGSKIVVADSSDNLNVAGILTSVGALNVGTGGTVITTTASGLVGLNSTSPAATIDIRTAPQWSSSNYGADLIIGGSRNNSLGLLDSNNAQPWAIANTGGTLTVATMPNLGDTSTAPTNRMQIGSGGDVTVNDGNLVIGTSGHGISFAATAGPTNGTGTSELLDDYEEGTWTPTLFGTTTAGTFSPSSTANGGRYIKVGKKITAWFNCNGSLSGAAGNMRISGLPYNTAVGNNTDPSGSGNATYSTGSMQYWAGVSVMVNGPLTLPGSNTMYFHTYTTTSTSGSPPAVVNGSHNIHCVLNYYIS